MSKNPVLYKTLVVGVIILFIGIGIQPAIAVTPNTSDSNDCDICPSIEDLIDRKDVKKYQELLDKINSLKEENDGLNSDTILDYPIICFILLKVVILSNTMIEFIGELNWKLYFVVNLLGMIFAIVMHYGGTLNCWEFP
jgi:hypothetical protein